MQSAVKIHMETRTRFFMHGQHRNSCIDLNQILHVDGLHGNSDTVETVSKLVQGFGTPTTIPCLDNLENSRV